MSPKHFGRNEQDRDVLRSNSPTKSRQESEEFSSLLFSHLYSFALRFIFLQTHATSYSFYSAVILFTVKEKGGKPDRKPYALLYGLKNTYRYLRSENSQDYA
jgi:hypothetical protein